MILAVFFRCVRDVKRQLTAILLQNRAVGISSLTPVAWFLNVPRGTLQLPDSLRSSTCFPSISPRPLDLYPSSSICSTWNKSSLPYELKYGHRLIPGLHLRLGKINRTSSTGEGGVPVSKRPNSNPASANDADNPKAAASTARPPARWFCPTCIKPFRNVPVVTTLSCHGIALLVSFLPHTPPHLSTSALSTDLWRKSRFGSRSQIHFNLNWIRLLIALRPRSPNRRSLFRVQHPELQSVMSVAFPISPPIASISLAKCPFASPANRGIA